MSLDRVLDGRGVGRARREGGGGVELVWEGETCMQIEEAAASLHLRREPVLERATLLIDAPFARSSIVLELVIDRAATRVGTKREW